MGKIRTPGNTSNTESMHQSMEGIRRSGRLKCKGPIIEENSIDEAIDVDEYLSDEEGSDYSGEMQGDNTADGASTSGIKKIEDEKDEKITKKRKKDNTMGKQEGKKLKREKKSPSKKYKGVGTNTYMFQTRNSPRAFFNAISKLSPIQKSCLEQLGFGKLLHFKVEGIPSKLGFYVVNNFDETTMEIKLNSRVADMNFKLNFIVLFTSVMGCVKTKRICDLSVLNHIQMDTNLAKVNWCSYCWRCLKKCKDGWKNTVTNSFFLGPITLLTMMYVDGTLCKDFIVGRKRPPTIMWTKELLKERELAEIKCGGLGKGELAGPYLEEQDDPMPDNLEGFIWKLNNYVVCINKERSGFERTFDAAKVMFPGNTTLDELKKRFIESLKYQEEENADIGRESVHTEDETMANEGREQGMEPGERTGRGLDSPRYQLGPQTQAIVCETADKLYKESERKKMMDFSDIPSFSLGLTQEEYDMEADREDVNIYDREENRVKARQDPLEVVPLNFFSPTNEVIVRGRRAVTLTDRMKSPFYVRVVNADKVENSEEKQLANFLFNKRDGDDSDVMFKTKYGHQSSRGQIETLGPQEPVDDNVLSSWSAYLNFMEEKKDSISPARLFFPTFEVDTKLFAGDNAYTLEMFMEYAENANSSYGGPTMLEKADIVFIPVSNDQQKFLVCVNLKNPAVTFIDSKKEGNKVTRKKKKDDGVDDMRVATILHRNFGQYLYAINHAKAAKIIQSQIVRGNFSWQTNRRAKDCGIFLMRHMECYMGSDNGKWKCGLDVEGKKQNTQLGRLRNKYAAKLLLSDCNIYKGKIREEMDGK
ncbi:C2 calcium-dependent membrane-targeting protein [Tanacetum coccineum]